MTSADEAPTPAPGPRLRRNGVWRVLWWGLPLLLAAAAYRFTRAPGDPNPASDPHSIHLRVVVLSNDDGSRRARIDVHEIQASLDFANTTYEPAQIQFVFDPQRDMEERHDTLLNGMAGPDQKRWIEIKDRANRVAWETPDRITVFYRHGPQTRAASHSFASLGYDFIGMPGYMEQIRCGEPSTSALAHEIGHYLGLWHTFREPRPHTLAEADALARKERRTPKSFNGDRLDDTAPDPGIREHHCTSPASFELAGHLYEPPVDNIMSYFYLTRHALSPRQIEIVRWVFDYRRAHAMRLQAGRLPEAPIEAESLALSGTCEHTVEDMTQFHKYRWSGGAQLLIGEEIGCYVDLALEVPETGTYALEMWATRLPSYGQVQASLDGVPIGGTVDLYAILRLSTGPIELARLDLEAGTHRLRLRISGKHEAATRTLAGIDAFALRPEAGPMLIRLPASADEAGAPIR